MSTKLSRHNNHNYFMSLALKRANINLGNTKKNPSVGCVIIKNNLVISAGFTSINGKPHAEYNAIKNSKVNLKKSQLYSTLEPCSHYGKTPPCINLISQKKIESVFFSIKDPDVRSFNKCHSKLKGKEISVKNGYLSKNINLFYSSYKNFKTNKLPFVTAKLAISKDYFTINKKKKWITNIFSRGRVHLMRSQHDCIITSCKTIKKDDPKLNCRINGLIKRSPSRIILDRKLEIPTNSQVIKDASLYKTIIFYNSINEKKIKILKKLNVSTYRIPLNSENKLDLNLSLKKAQLMGFSRIFLESGLELTVSFFNKNLISDFKLFISNEKLNNKGLNNAKKKLSIFLKNKKKKTEKINLLGDKLISYKIK